MQAFLSTLSLRRATTQYFTALHNILISIHALLAESDRSRPHWAWRGSISIHALLAESDPAVLPHPARGKYFYPRSPCGERRTASTGDYLTANISIHALLAESDPTSYVGMQITYNHFYPRSPCGERRWHTMRCAGCPDFYPRSPCGERRNRIRQPIASSAISIHALLAESDAPFSMI